MSNIVYVFTGIDSCNGKDWSFKVFHWDDLLDSKMICENALWYRKIVSGNFGPYNIFQQQQQKKKTKKKNVYYLRGFFFPSGK